MPRRWPSMVARRLRICFLSACMVLGYPPLLGGGHQHHRPGGAPLSSYGCLSVRGAGTWPTPGHPRHDAEFQSTFVLDEDAGFDQLAERLSHLRVEARHRYGSNVGARQPALRVTALQVLVDGGPPGLRSKTLLAREFEQILSHEVVNEIERLIVLNRAVALDNWQ